MQGYKLDLVVKETKANDFYIVAKVTSGTMSKQSSRAELSLQKSQPLPYLMYTDGKQSPIHLLNYFPYLYTVQLYLCTEFFCFLQSSSVYLFYETFCVTTSPPPICGLVLRQAAIWLDLPHLDSRGSDGHKVGTNRHKKCSIFSAALQVIRLFLYFTNMRVE